MSMGNGADDAQLMTVSQVMRRIHAVILRERGGTSTGIGADVLWPENFEIWSAVQQPAPDQQVYAVGDLLAHEDADFVANAYRALLRRPADSVGLTANLEGLRSGAITKLAVLASIRFSPEGIARGIPVKGLRKAWLIERWKQKPVFGPALSWAHELLRLGSRPIQAERTRGRLSQETHRLGRHVNQVVLQAGSRLEQLEQDFEAIRTNRLVRLERRLASLTSTVNRLEERETRLRDLESLEVDRSARLDSLYSAFEDEFRGSMEVVRERMAPYLGDVRACGAGTPEAPIIDVGCGRGEWLQLLRENGLIARGFDLNAKFVEQAREQGLDVIHGDAIALLKSLPRGSVGAITSMHLVEHLPFAEVVEMIDACKHALRPGGALILETPNPENLDVATLYFYMDPTHRNPLPPSMLEFVVAARGFKDATIRRLTVARPLASPPLLGQDVPGAESVNAMLARLHVAPDYAIVATNGDGDVDESV